LVSEPKRLIITCPECKQKRAIYPSNYKALKNGGLCKKCYMSKLLTIVHERMRNRPMSERKPTSRSDGYLEMSLPSWHWCYPMATKTRHSILVHRLVMAEHLGRLLEAGEIVHHINGIRTDNRIENLQLVTLGSHKLSYEEGYKQGFKDGMATNIEELRKEIRLLHWKLKETERFGV